MSLPRGPADEPDGVETAPRPESPTRETARQPWRDGAVRRIGYRLLPGEGYSYVLHTRPREWSIVAAHAYFGFLIALPEGPEIRERWLVGLAGVLVFVVFLNGGTLAINSAFDQDEGDIGYLDSPPPPPPHLFGFGLALMLTGAILAALLFPAGFAFVYGACLAMSIVYSVPPFRWKAIAGLDLLINAAGFGVLTAAAGWTLSGAVISTWSAAVLLAFGPLFAALYPLTQLYQFEEDERRGDRTLALVMGMGNALRFALAMTVVAFGLLAWGLASGPGASMWPILVIPFAFWSLLLLRWLGRYPTMSPAEHKRGMYTALQAWALTNATVLAAILLPWLTT